MPAYIYLPLLPLGAGPLAGLGALAGLGCFLPFFLPPDGLGTGAGLGTGVGLVLGAGVGLGAGTGFCARVRPAWRRAG